MSILDSKNITKVLIALIIIFGIIFIIVGERPRHKANVKNTVKSSTSQTVEKAPRIKEKSSEPKPAPKQEVKKEISGKELINQKYKNNDNSFMQKAIEDHNAKKERDKKLEAFSKKDNVDSKNKEEGLQVNTEKINMNKQDEEKIQKEEDVDAKPLKSLVTLSKPDVDESPDINPAITKERKLQDKYPLRYSSSTAADTNTVYLIDTATAQVSILQDGNTYWINLGKPNGATTKPVSTYTLEGVTKDSAVVMDTSTAEAWRVTVSKDNIKWTVITPFKSTN